MGVDPQAILEGTLGGRWDWEELEARAAALVRPPVERRVGILPVPAPRRRGAPPAPDAAAAALPPGAEVVEPGGIPAPGLEPAYWAAWARAAGQRALVRGFPVPAWATWAGAGGGALTDLAARLRQAGVRELAPAPLQPAHLTLARRLTAAGLVPAVALPVDGSRPARALADTLRELAAPGAPAWVRLRLEPCRQPGREPPLALLGRAVLAARLLLPVAELAVRAEHLDADARWVLNRLGAQAFESLPGGEGGEPR